MKRIVMLLLPLLLLLAACGSGGAAVVEEEGFQEVAPQPTTADEPTAPATAGTDEAVTAAPESATADDPLQARERDWKLGDLVDPAVTIIEYGDFQ
ncbi:hypothetical protein [Promineifilum sp.]|uniref:hypothetical protein n=1 Tax=Promineifilum sp. TaxID=2664178 RepID=UPI0035B0396C